MLDTHVRDLVQPFFSALARRLSAKGVRPLQVTLWSLGAGVLAACFLVQGWTWLFLSLLWLSGMLDAVDGTLARLDGTVSRFGALLDIVCDRFVEGAVLLAFAWKYPEGAFQIVALCCAIILSLTVFLTAAAVLPNTSSKSFHYQAGLTERTEGFLFFSLMALMPEQVGLIALVFSAAVMFTAMQRFLAAARVFRD